MKKRSKISPYLLLDYGFLQDYEIIETYSSNNFSFIAQIKNTTQLVKFSKVQYTDQKFSRFQALVKLFKTGIVLADNIFILEESGIYYFYIIEAHIQHNSYCNSSLKQRFITLQQYLLIKDLNKQQRRNLFNKVKLLLERVHQTCHFYGGLTSEKILIDEDNNIYLAPFKLSHQLPNSPYENAYRPPEILNKIMNNQFEIEQKILCKWDIWSFGCLCLQFFVTISPFYHSVSIRSQLNKINSLDYLQEQILGLQEPVKNLIFNCLTYSPELRSTISQKRINPPKQKNEKKLQYCQNTYQQKQNAQNRGKSIGDSELIFHILSISNMDIEQQLKIVVHLNKPYHYYLDKQKAGPQRILFDKKIVIRDDFTHFQTWLNEPITIYLQQSHKHAKVQINLQTLILTYEGKRVWDKKLIGSYEAQPNQFYPNLKLKLSCHLTTPAIVDKRSFEQNRKILESINQNYIKDFSTKASKKERKKSLNSFNLDKLGFRNKKNIQIEQSLIILHHKSQQQSQKKSQQKFQTQLACIKDVKQSLSQLTNHWRNRVLLTPKNNNQSEEITHQKINDILSIK